MTCDMGAKHVVTWDIVISEICLLFSSFFPVFSTGLVWLYIAGLQMRSCRTIGAPSVQGSAQDPLSVGQGTILGPFCLYSILMI